MGRDGEPDDAESPADATGGLRELERLGPIVQVVDIEGEVEVDVGRDRGGHRQERADGQEQVTAGTAGGSDRVAHDVASGVIGTGTTTAMMRESGKDDSNNHHRHVE